MRRVTAGLIAASAMASAVSGCDVYSGATEGEDGVLSFYEPNDYPGESSSSAYGFELPIALGARADVWILADAGSQVTGAEIEDPTILGMDFDIYPIVLRARAEGQTRLHVSTTGGSDSLLLTVVEPDDAQIWTVTSTPLFGQPDSFFGDGYALRPGATLEVAAQPKRGNTRLLGFDVLEWSIDETLFAFDDAGGTVNTLRLQALGNSGVTQVTTQFGGSLEIATLSAIDVPTLTLYSFATDMGTPPVASAITPQDLALFLIAATDAAGRNVVPAFLDDGGFEAVIVEGNVVLVEAQHSGHNVSLRACTGTGTLRLSYLGAELTVPIEVTPAFADAVCP
jgi:hypothetical protein